MRWWTLVSVVLFGVAFFSPCFGWATGSTDEVDFIYRGWNCLFVGWGYYQFVVPTLLWFVNIVLLGLWLAAISGRRLNPYVTLCVPVLTGLLLLLLWTGVNSMKILLIGGRDFHLLYGSSLWLLSLIAGAAGASASFRSMNRELRSKGRPKSDA